MKSAFNKIFGRLNTVFAPYYFSFLSGHWYLENNQIEQLAKILSGQEDSEAIVADFERRFARLIGSGNGISFAAGRMGFYVLMKILGIGEGDEVILPAFTCSVMVNAVWRTGARPVFVDIDPDTFGSDAKAIKERITHRTKLIVAQHSFGIPCKIDKIVELGKEHGIFIVEDCAITLDSSYKGISVGNWGDAAIFSTDHSKPLNTLIGGFLYTKEPELFNKIQAFSDNLPELEYSHQRRLFRTISYERSFYDPKSHPRMKTWQIPRLIMRKVLSTVSKCKPFVFLEADYENTTTCNAYPYPAKLPSFMAQLGLFELKRWPMEKKRRKQLLDEYLRRMGQTTVWQKYIPKCYFDQNNNIVPLRFAFNIPNANLWKRLMGKRIDINWIWFREPIICCLGGVESMGYSLGSCPNAEKTNQQIINWPCVVSEGWEGKLVQLFKDVTRRIDLDKQGV